MVLLESTYLNDVLMKKKVYILVSLLVLILTSCDNEGQFVDDGYARVEVSFIYPSIAISNYKILFNEEEINSGVGYIDKNNLTGALEIYENTTNKLIFSEKISFESNKKIQLIKLPDQDIEIYDTDKYTQFNLNITWISSEQSALYEATLNGRELDFGNNYISIDDLNGTFQLQKIDDSTIVMDKDVTVESNGNLVLMQLSSTDFLFVGNEEEESPESDYFSKVRFYYTSTTELPDESYTMKIYTMDGWAYDASAAIEVGTITIKASELSSYVLADGRSFQNITAGPTILIYDLIDANGITVRDRYSTEVYLDQQGYDGDYLYKPLYKFQTWRINNASAIFSFGDKW